MTTSPHAQPLLSIKGLTKHFPLKRSLFGKADVVRAVEQIDFDVLSGETLGVVGESGCGKSTTARLLMHLIAPTAGEVMFDGALVGSRDLPLKEFRRQVQMVFQDSYASLNPRLTIEDSIAFGPQVHGVSRKDSHARANDLLARVGLEPARYAARYPHELSGGQRQRVNIARALALRAEGGIRGGGRGRTVLAGSPCGGAPRAAPVRPIPSPSQQARAPTCGALQREH